MLKVLFAFLICLPGFAANAMPLKLVNVAAPAINCVFSASCSVRVRDTIEDFQLSGGGKGILQTRTFTGASGSPADGLFVYQYRLDLTEAVGAKRSCVDWISLSFGAVVSNLNFGGDDRPDQVFVITSGGTGSIGLAPALIAATALVLWFFGAPLWVMILVGWIIGLVAAPFTHRLDARQLAERLRLRIPELKVIFTSGYLGENVDLQGDARMRFDFLPKPFLPRVVAQKVREALDS